MVFKYLEQLVNDKAYLSIDSESDFLLIKEGCFVLRNSLVLQEALSESWDLLYDQHGFSHSDISLPDSFIKDPSFYLIEPSHFEKHGPAVNTDLFSLSLHEADNQNYVFLSESLLIPHVLRIRDLLGQDNTYGPVMHVDTVPSKVNPDFMYASFRQKHSDVSLLIPDYQYQLIKQNNYNLVEFGSLMQGNYHVPFLKFTANNQPIAISLAQSQDSDLSVLSEHTILTRLNSDKPLMYVNK